jgi:hypothetical protein
MKRDFRFMPSLESLDERANPSALAGAPDAASDEPVVLEGHQALVFYLGGIPSRPDASEQASASAESSDGRKFKMPVAPLVIDLDGAAIRHRTFAIVDRTSMTADETAQIDQISLWSERIAAVTGDGTAVRGGGKVLVSIQDDPFATAQPGETASSKDIVLKGQTIKENATATSDRDETITIHANRAEGPSGTHNGNVYTVTFGGSL